jgi:prophage antirepressor-like protein
MYTLVKQRVKSKDASYEFHCIMGPDLWIEGRVIAKFLGYSNDKRALEVNVDSEQKRQFSEFSIKSNINYNVVFATEVGIIQLVMRSRLSKAHALKEWIISQVVPTIKQRFQHHLLENVKRDKEIEIGKIENEKQVAIRKLKTVEQEKQTIVERIETEKQIAMRKAEVVEKEKEELRLKNENLIIQLQNERQRNRENRHLYENTLLVIASTLVATRNATGNLYT